MQKNQHFSNFYFLLALGLISLFAYTIIFSAISLIRGFSISAWLFPAATFMMLVTQFYASRELFPIKPGRIFFKSSGILLGLILTCLILAHSIYDISFDGQWYHQETVYQMKNGWNPYYKELPVPKIPGIPGPRILWCSGPHIPPKENPEGEQNFVNIKYTSINYFPKAVEITEAAIYSITNRIETGKAINAMMLLASLFLCLSVFYKMNCWNSGKIWFLGILFAFNPVTIYQLTSYCLDGLMISTLICLASIFVLLILDKNKYNVFLFGLLVLISINIKFTSFLFASVFCLCFVTILVIKKKWSHLRSILIAGSLSLLTGFVFVGFHPYLTNLIAHNVIFYGLKETRNEIDGECPTYLINKNRFEKFIISTGAESFNTAGEQESLRRILKIPFTVTQRELLEANNAEPEMAGFGPFFSGALILAVILLVMMTPRFLKEPILKEVLIILSFLLLTIFLIPDPWWARFIPQCWLFPVIVLLLSEILPFRGLFIKPVLYISLSLNILWALSGILFNILISVHINYQIDQLKTVSQPVSVEYCGYRDFSSNRIRLMENNIPFKVKNVTGPHIYNIIHSNTRFETPDELPFLPEPFLMVLKREWSGTVRKKS